MARGGEGNGYAAGSGAPLDDGTGFAVREGEPEGRVLVVDVFEVVEVGQRIVFGQGGSFQLS